MEKWLRRLPFLERVAAAENVLWINKSARDNPRGLVADGPAWHVELSEARRRLERFRSFVAVAFPETSPSGGRIESPLTRAVGLQAALEGCLGRTIPGTLYVKEDNRLPIAGSIKARGGLYEVFAYAEELALQSGLPLREDDYSVLATDAFHDFLGRYALSVGSTGNLGLSVGIGGAALGLNTTVYMSAEAREWKKRLLRARGVSIHESEADFSAAVAEGREQARRDRATHFVDDENSRRLFTGYAVAAFYLEEQLKRAGIAVGENNPLFVYLPCGVGGGPSGLALGLKLVFGPHVHCFFVEPVASPCMLLGLATGEHDGVSVYDFGLDNRTAADGLAVARCSAFAGKLVENLVAGVLTVKDDELFRLLALAAEGESLRLEPSAAASLAGPHALLATPEGEAYLEQNALTAYLSGATHLAWSTGGGLVPPEVYRADLDRGRALLAE